MKTLFVIAAFLLGSRAFAAEQAPGFDSFAPWTVEKEAPLPPAAGEARPRTPNEPVLDIGVVEPVLRPADSLLLARVDLADQLDRHLKLPELLWSFNGHPFYASVALDRDRRVFLAFTPQDGGPTLLAPTDGLLKNPVEIQLTGNTRYKVSLKINIFDPINSTIVMAPARGTRGETHSVRGGKLAEYVRAHSPSFEAGGSYILLYGRNADGGSLRIGSGRSLFFLKDAGLSSKAYSVAEDQVPVGRWTSASLGDEKVLLYRPSENSLEIRQP